MIPFLTYPLALLALASLPALAAIYILRNRFRRRKVSSLMLWRFRVQAREGGSRIQRLQLPLLFFLELLALLLLVVAATGPHWKLPRSTRPLIVVLDDSFSMGAADGNVTAKDRAREFLGKLFRFQAPPSTRLVLAGREPRLLGPSAANWPEVEKLLDRWSCTAPAASIQTAITLATELGKQRANVLVLTDHAPPEEKFTSDRLEWHAFGKPLDNIAIVNASRSANGDQDRCLVEIANFSTKPAASNVRVQTGTNVLQRNLLSFGSRGQERLVFNLADSAPGIEVTLDSDALSEDNRIQLLPPIRRRVRVRVAVTNAALDALIERTLEATGLRSAISQDPQLVIHQSDAVALGTNGWSLHWVTPEKATAYTGPFVIDDTHPLGEGLALEGVIWAAAPATNAPGDVPIIMAGNVPLLSVREDLSGREFLTIDLDPQLSTLQKTPGWPILFWNLLQWRASQIPGLAESNARLGTEVMLKTGDQPVRITWPDGTLKSFPQTSDELALETPLPGLYSVVLGQSTNSLAVNPLAADESDLASCATGQWGNWRKDAEQRFELSPLAWLFALAALAVLTTHLFLLATGKGGH